MDEDKRRQLEARRRFMQRRVDVRALRAEMEPAISALEAAAETFRTYALGEVPQWTPAWMPPGYSRVPWRELDWVGFRRVDDRAAMVATLRELLAERLGPDDEMLFLPDGKAWSMGMTRGAFDAHADALLEAAWDAVYFAAPPAQWLIQANWSEIWWKDPEREG